MRPSLRQTIMSCLALLPIATTGCSSVGKLLVPELVNVERPLPDAVLMQGCPAPPPMPPRSALPSNDVRPLVAVLMDQVGAGDQCRTVVEGWKAWDDCMRVRTKDAKAACPALEAILEQLKPPDPKTT